MTVTQMTNLIYKNGGSNKFLINGEVKTLRYRYIIVNQTVEVWYE